MMTPITPFSSLLTRGNPLHSSQTNSNAFSAQSGLKGVGYLGDNNQRRDSFELFNSILQRAYRQIAFSPPGDLPTAQSPDAMASEITQYENVAKISSQQAADTILNFITRRLKLDAANGADQEALIDRLEQGLKGFIQGFNEAKDQIEGMGLLTSQLSDEINDTYERVTNGIEQLRQQILDNEVSEVSRLSLAGDSSESSSFSLQLTTQDGDRVSIEISQASQSSFSTSLVNDKGLSSLSINQQSLSSSSFSLNVIGELDQGELDAINLLLQDINEIADDFFGGRLDEAFAQALELNIDRDELTGLNLQLQKTTTIRALAAYESTSRNELSPAATLSRPLNELNQLLDGIEGTLAEARKFAEPLALIDDLASGIARISNHNNEYHENNDLNEMLSSLVSQFKL